jgi:hypothetical protein
MTPAQEAIVNKVAILTAMEFELDPKIVFDYAVLLATVDRKTMAGFLVYRRDGARKAMSDMMMAYWATRRSAAYFGSFDVMDTEDGRAVHERIVSCLKREHLIR